LITILSDNCFMKHLSSRGGQEKHRLLNEQVAGRWTLTLTEPTQFGGQTASLVCVTCAHYY
jgi:hypothetical protein